MGGIYPGQSTARTGYDHWPPPLLSVEDRLCRGPLHRAGLTSSGLWCPLVFCLGPLGISYKVTGSWLLLVLGLEVPWIGQAMNQGQLLLVLGLGQLTRYWGLLRPAAACLRGFRNVRHDLRQAIPMEKPLETGWVGHSFRESSGRGKQCEPGWWSLW